MPLAFTTTQPGASADYIKYTSGKPIKTDSVNEPTLFDFVLAPWDLNFVKLNRGAYLTFDTVTYPKWFTGYVTNEPQLEYLGTNSAGGQVYGYRYQATDDSYILNLKPVGLWQPFINTTAGAIIKQIVSRLDPNATFDVTGVQNGVTLSRYVVDPNRKFTEIVKELADISAFRFRAHDKKLHFEAKDATPATITVDGNSKHFTPSRLLIQPTLDPVINDVIVVGSVEPQGYINEYFVGDGFTAAFPLLSGIYGVDNSVLLDEDFGGSQINSATWSVFDTVNQWLKATSGYLNVTGGSADNSYDVYLKSNRLIPLEGNLRLTHGQFDFVPSGANSTVHGVVGGLWTGNPNSSLTGCIYGIRVERDGSGNFILKPVVNGSVDGTKTLTINTSKRYVLRTLCSFEKSNRQSNTYSYVAGDGSVGTYGGGTSADIVHFKTWIVEIDPADGSIDATTEWQNLDVSIASGDVFASYLPVASNDLHVTVTGITVSTPMLVSLEIKPDGGSIYERKLVGPNEIDAQDGLAPIATVVTEGGGVREPSQLGSPKYNPGNATLNFFKDTTKQVSYIPQVRDLVHLSYRRAGVCLARVQDAASVISEAASWGDNGLRSLTRIDLSPAPRTSEECEFAAAAILKEFGVQHYDGSYTQFHPYEFSGEPLSGTILEFQNMPSQFPASLQAEVIHQIQTTLHSAQHRELFEHVIHFGKQEHLKKALAKFAGRDATVGIVDAAEIPSFVHLNSVGGVYAPDVTAPFLVSYDASNLNFNTGQAAPSGGGFEVRYTDESWGADDGRNLITRTTGQTFSVPRTARGKIAFVRAYDTRNKLLYSEDLTQSAWVKSGSVTVSNSTELNPDGNTSSVSVVSFPSASGSNVVQTSGVAAASAQAVFTVDLKGTPGKVVQISVGDNNGWNTTANVTLTSAYQRKSISFTFGGGAVGNIRVRVNIPNSGAHDVRVTRASLEVGTLTETGYFKTNGTVYGALSRFSAGLRVNFPLAPPAPTGSVDYTDESNPVISVVLPGVLQDVWGVEIRASDNSTVLYKKDLTDAGYTPTFTHAGNTSRSLSYYLYTYNLLGEYSTAYNLTGTIPTPSASGLTVDEDTKMVKWTGANTPKGYKVEIATDVGYTTKTVDTETVDEFFQLQDTDFFPQRYIRITPFDDIGNGSAVTTSHVYTPVAPVSFDADEVEVVAAPAGPGTNPSVPTPINPWRQEYIEQVLRNYRINVELA